MAPRAPFWPHTCPEFHSLRLAVRTAIKNYAHTTGSTPPGVVVGLSGGADSLALVAACAAETLTPAGSLHDGYVHAVIVDHGLQDNSASVAARAARQAAEFGASTQVCRVDIPQVSGGDGPEAVARTARHDQLRAIAGARGVPLLLAHTMDDQAETVVLRLARGGGPQALAAMAEQTTWSDGVVLLRPLLGHRRHQTRAACVELGVAPWHDPHNDDRRYARVRVRHDILPLLEDSLGPGVVANLAKTATVAARDNEALDAIARVELDRALAGAALADPVPTDSAPTGAAPTRGRLPVVAVAKQYEAVQARMIRTWLHAHGCAPGTRQIHDVLKLVNQYHGQGPISIPKGAHTPGAGLVVARKGGTLAVLELSAAEKAGNNSAERQRKGQTDA